MVMHAQRQVVSGQVPQAWLTLLLSICRYQLLEKDDPNKVVFFGCSRFHESTDTVTFRQKPGAKDIVVVEYNTDIELVRWYK